MKNQTFPPVSFTDWRSAAEASLKGKPLSKLKTKTPEGIELKPLYTKEDRKTVLSLPGEKPFTRGFNRVPAFPETDVKIGVDPISSGAAAGIFPADSVLQEIHNQEIITVNTVPYHLAGANAVQELALALAEAVCLIGMAENKNEAAAKCVIHFAAGPVFFTELAKIRAFRTLWSAFMGAYNLNEKAKPKLSVETSEAMLSLLDPHVNILRTGSAAFSAVIGNVDYLTVKPFDEVTGCTTGLSKRIAHNIPRLLKHEALLDKVTDPAGGSYYVESLTEEIGRLAWDLFADIEEAGGIREALMAGTIQKDIAAVQAKKERNLAVRHQQMIGTNVYANPTEQIDSMKKEKAVPAFDGEPIEPLELKRMAEPFEALRLASVQLSQTEQSVAAGLICLGELKKYKPRADYVAGVLAVAGIEPIRSESCKTIQEAVQFIERHPLPYYCICGPDELYDQLGSSLAAELRKAANGAVIDIAGTWSMDGTDGRIAAGDDIVQKLMDVLSLYKGGAVT